MLFFFIICFILVSSWFQSGWQWKSELVLSLCVLNRRQRYKSLSLAHEPQVYKLLAVVPYTISKKASHLPNSTSFWKKGKRRYPITIRVNFKNRNKKRGGITIICFQCNTKLSAPSFLHISKLKSVATFFRSTHSGYWWTSFQRGTILWNVKVKIKRKRNCDITGRLCT